MEFGVEFKYIPKKKKKDEYPFEKGTKKDVNDQRGVPLEKEEEEKNLVLWIWSPPLTMTVPYCSLWEITSCCLRLNLNFLVRVCADFSSVLL